MSFKFVEFSVSNYKQFRDKQNFSLAARKHGGHTFSVAGEEVLRLSVIYGQNASGKSTLLNAISAFRNYIVDSADLKDNSFPRFPCLLDKRCVELPTEFEIVFALDNKLYTYNCVIDSHVVLKEELKVSGSGKKEKVLISRTKSIVDGEFASLVGKHVRKESLILTLAAFLNHPLAISIIEGFKHQINVLVLAGGRTVMPYTVKQVKNSPERKIKILELLKRADFTIEDIVIDQKPVPDDLREVILKISADKVPESFDSLRFAHPISDNAGSSEMVTFTDEMESTGTNQFLSLLGPIVDTLEGGKTLFLDEFDMNLHPSLTAFILDLFLKENPNNAQLIVTAHDVTLLDKDELSKYHFWFTEKTKEGYGRLFALSDFAPDARNKATYVQKYLLGAYGGVPLIKNFPRMVWGN